MSKKKMLPLKYTNYGLGFLEVPNEVSLLINVSNCPCNCDGCHSPQLQENIGEFLTIESLETILSKFSDTPITCICFMGEGGNIPAIGKLIEHCHNKGFLTCLYTGSTNTAEIINSSNKTLNFIKVGRYYKEHGPLNKKGTNQRFYEIQYHRNNSIEWYELNDLTYKFQQK